MGSKIQSELIITSLLPALVSCRLGERAFTFQLSQLNGRYHVLWDWKLLGDEELHVESLPAHLLLTRWASPPGVLPCPGKLLPQPGRWLPELSEP